MQSAKGKESTGDKTLLQGYAEEEDGETEESRYERVRCPRLVGSNKFSFLKQEVILSREYRSGRLACNTVLFSQEGWALSDQKGGCV